ncbi:PREDICTED: protein SAR DEFICIENT 1-like [Nicotiana attenuata]|uniref:Protein sar deficient 1 n=1 Tax=Nicotiana attenuata TaxID=49451 RepID=A0A1J6JGS5_NICAT|nr:PREDICTED: protein SAR DEFICIENT 1-like [Nicotiana attenuata]OIT06177.1 protein sar deficient 1 [Nicotiana attenuata]
MAAKRYFDDSADPHSNHSNYKRMRKTPSFASVIKEVVMVNFLDNFCSALEPMLRRVVHEEVENGLRRCSRSIGRSPSLRIKAMEPSNLRLIFNKKPSLPIFTNSKIVDSHGHPLQLLLVDATGDCLVPTTLASPIKVEIVVLDGDFPIGENEATWTNEEFNKNMVKERVGKRPLLTGELNITMRDGVVSLGDLEFTDNSSWIRSRKFRIGAKVVHVGKGQNNVRILEAMTDSFMVKDHRGELYKKHYPPALGDDVWRLEKIGKDGTFHKKLTSHGIKTVQDFLKLANIDSEKLRRILGSGMSEKMWEVTYRHAKTCEMGTKSYIARGTTYTLFLNPICQVVKAIINGQICHSRELRGIQRAYIENLVKDAYINWSSLEEVDGGLVMNEQALLTQGEPKVHHQNAYQQQHTMLRSTLMIASGSEQAVEYNDWNIVNSAHICSNGVRYIPESSSEGELHYL